MFTISNQVLYQLFHLTALIKENKNYRILNHKSYICFNFSCFTSGYTSVEVLVEPQSNLLVSCEGGLSEQVIKCSKSLLMEDF